MDETRAAWSDLGLALCDGPQPLVEADSPRNLYEKLVFVAPATQVLDVRVQARQLTAAQLPFGVAICELDPPTRLGGFTSFGSSCLGTGDGDGVGFVLPAGLEKRFGNVWAPVPLGFVDHRFQQLFDMSSRTQRIQIEGIALRHDETEVYRHLAYTLDLEIRMGYSDRDPENMSRQFAANYASQPTVVLSRRKVQLPVLEEANSNPRRFDVRFQFDRPFLWEPAPGRHLCLELIRHGSSVGDNFAFYMLDAEVDGQKRVSSLLQAGANAHSGSLSLGWGSVVGFITGDGKGQAYPYLAYESVPVVGQPFRLTLARARGGSPGAFVFGVSNSRWLQLGLPLDFAAGGAPGCALRSSVEIVHPLLFDKRGRGVVDFPLPPQRLWAGRRIFAQGLILDPSANRLGLVTTNGLEARIAGDR